MSRSGAETAQGGAPPKPHTNPIHMCTADTTAVCCCYCCCCAATEVNVLRAVAATAAVLLLLRLIECRGYRATVLRTKQRRTKNCTKIKVHQKIKFCKTISGVPSDLVVSGRRNAIPCQIEPDHRRSMRRAPPQSSAEIQTCFIMYPSQVSLPRGRKCEKKPSAAGEQRAKKKRR